MIAWHKVHGATPESWRVPTYPTRFVIVHHKAQHRRNGVWNSVEYPPQVATQCELIERSTNGPARHRLARARNRSYTSKNPAELRDLSNFELATWISLCKCGFWAVSARVVSLSTIIPIRHINWYSSFTFPPGTSDWTQRRCIYQVGWPETTCLLSVNRFNEM